MFISNIFHIFLLFLVIRFSSAELRSQLSESQISLIQKLLDEFDGIEISFNSIGQSFPENQIFFALLEPNDLTPLIELDRRENLVTLSIAEGNFSKKWSSLFDGSEFRLYLRESGSENLLFAEKGSNHENNRCLSNEISNKIREGHFKMLFHPNVSVNVTVSITNSIKLQKSCDELVEHSSNETNSEEIDDVETKKLEQYCEYGNLFYFSGETFQPAACDRCRCQNREISCKFESPVPCDDSTPEWLRGCCPEVKHNDYCSPSPCDLNANCTNLIDRADCICQEGFTGDGTTCADVDECQFDEAAREQLGGCLVGTICVNTPGSFRCDCLPGHQRIDDRNCLDVLRI